MTCRSGRRLRLRAVIGEQLGKKLGQAVIVDNRPGAGGSVGGSNVVQSAPDGYTLMLSNSTPASIGPFALEKQPYDPTVDLTHIASIGSAPCVVMANPAAGIHTIIDLENAARKAGSVQFGSVTSAQRSPLALDVQAVGEFGKSNLVLEDFFGLSGPAKMPGDLIARLNVATNEVLAQPDIRKRLLELGVTVTPGTPADFTGFFRNQVNALAPVVKTVRVTL
jgi:tripartite-type tricarboxylate transporter receptor subunit TctC